MEGEESEGVETMAGDEGGLPLTHPPAENLALLVQEEDWSEEYKKCPAWSRIWEAAQDHEQEWPEGTENSSGKLYGNGKLCNPWTLQDPWIQEQHRFLGHVGFQRLWATIGDRFFWARWQEAKAYAQKVSRECTTCQACDPPISLKRKIHPFYSPSHHGKPLDRSIQNAPSLERQNYL